jgi:hypothetical protein
MAQTFHTVPDRSSGDVFTEAMWDDNIRTNINNLIVPPMFRATSTANVVAGGAGTVNWTFTTEQYDTDGMMAAAGTAFTPTTAGVYLMVANFITYTESALTRIQWQVNGARDHTFSTQLGVHLVNLGTADSVGIGFVFSGAGTVTYANASVHGVYLGATALPA